MMKITSFSEGLRSAACSRDPEILLKNMQSFFWLFILLHTILWTLGPFLTRDSLPHDTLEGISWGMQWQWGYNKHPFLAAWLCAGVIKLFNAVEWPVYLLAQLAALITFVATLQLARKVLPPLHAIIAVLALDGVLYYNINSFNFTPDTLQSPLWALLVLFFYQATKTQSIRYWLATGLMMALSVMTKYQAAMLFLPMLLFCLINTTARVSFFKPGLYLASGLIFIMIMPHLFWLWTHDFSTIRYALGAPYGSPQKAMHLVSMLRYLSDCVAYVAGLFLLFWPFYGIKKHSVEKMHFTVSTFDWQFLMFLGLGPCLLTAIFCLINGYPVPSRWSTPYFFLLGIMVMAWQRTRISSLQLKQFVITLVILSGLLWGVRMTMIASHSSIRSDAYLPNKAIANKLTQLWKQHYSTPLHYLGGAHYLVGATIPYFMDKRPVPYFSLDQKESSWLHEKDVSIDGGLFIWDVGANYFWDAYSPKMAVLPEEVKQRFPNLVVLGTYSFYRTTSSLVPVAIGIALLPPSGVINQKL